MADKNTTLESSEKAVLSDSLFSFLSGKLADAESNLKFREDAEKSWLEGDAKEWAEAARLADTESLSRKQRQELSEREKRIAVKCRREVEMFKAAIAALTWQPIDTAPHDGSDILVTGLDGGTGPTRHTITARWEECPSFGGHFTDITRGSRMLDFLTHWKPILPPLNS